MEPRLKSGIWVAAYLRRCASDNVFAVVARKGDETAGSVIVKVNLLDGRARVFATAYDDKGERIWMAALNEDPASDADAESYIQRSISRDPDIWVIEVEDRTGDPHLEGY